jgi:hypothetical protein
MVPAPATVGASVAAPTFPAFVGGERVLGSPGFVASGDNDVTILLEVSVLVEVEEVEVEVEVVSMVVVVVVDVVVVSVFVEVHAGCVRDSTVRAGLRRPLHGQSWRGEEQLSDFVLFSPTPVPHPPTVPSLVVAHSVHSPYV